MHRKLETLVFGMAQACFRDGASPKKRTTRYMAPGYDIFPQVGHTILVAMPHLFIVPFILVVGFAQKSELWQQVMPILHRYARLLRSP